MYINCLKKTSLLMEKKTGKAWRQGKEKNFRETIKYLHCVS